MNRLLATPHRNGLSLIDGYHETDIICKGKEGVRGKEEKWELASCVAVSKLYAVSELCGSWPAVWE